MRVGPLKLKIQLICGDEIAMGPGKADVLEAIDREGSISAAGRALGMSYRRTWLLVDEMNRCFSEKVVETHQGGRHDRGAELTEPGRAVLAAYRALEKQAGRIARSPENSQLAAALRDQPLPAKSDV
ncbi:winged helix-turn-helix domain-containing protein [Novosphingobium lentum]|uniref:winged helix-turn-helix domain-containing protein n=1 Tax=Novosphingobium lentum TaxID=145287 RepID=UPI00082CE7F8|nr:LysR family transcriptional regulator [Novosphingobium lentum]